MERIEIPVGPFTFDALAEGPDDGELVVLLHGFPQTSSSWRSQLAALAEAGYRAVAPDQRGYSPRARPRDVADYGLDHLVADVEAMVDWLGGHRFHLVGHDWGAAVSWKLAGQSPERLRTLTVLSVPHPKAFAAALSGELGGDQAERSSYMALFAAEGTAELMVADDAALLRGVFVGSGLSEEAARPYVEALANVEALRAALNWYRAAASGAGLTGDLPSITTPTMFVWSTEDVALGREGAEATADHVDGPYRFEILEGVSHWIADQAPDKLNALLLEHLATHRD
ncbi:alpha/beta hydrolase [soil metagenome]